MLSLMYCHWVEVCRLYYVNVWLLLCMCWNMVVGCIKWICVLWVVCDIVIVFCVVHDLCVMIMCVKYVWMYCDVYWIMFVLCVFYVWLFFVCVFGMYVGVVFVLLNYHGGVVLCCVVVYGNYMCVEYVCGVCVVS